MSRHHVAVAVQDSGVGLSEDERRTIFDRCFQHRWPGGHGLGLGLYISRAIIEGHGGALATGVPSTPTSTCTRDGQAISAISTPMPRTTFGPRFPRHSSPTKTLRVDNAVGVAARVVDFAVLTHGYFRRWAHQFDVHRVPSRGSLMAR